MQRKKLAKIMIAFGMAAIPNLTYAIGDGILVSPSEPEAKFTVIVRWKEGGMCTGTLISPDVVLTASHCLAKYQRVEDPSNPGKGHLREERTSLPSELLVSFGGYNGREWDHRLEGEVIGVERFPFAKSRFLAPDLGMVRLKSPAPSTFTPLEVLIDPTKIQAGSAITLVGYGTTGLDPEPAERLLRKFPTLIESLATSLRQLTLVRSNELPRYRQQYQEGNDEVREKIDQAGLQGGDSGGPAYVTINGRPYLAGVASGFDSEMKPLYGNITLERPWLIKALSDLGAEVPGYLIK